LISSTTAQVGQPGPHYSSFIVYGRGYSKSIVVSPPSWEFFRGQIAVVGLKHYTTVRANGAAAGTSTLAGTARFITVAAGTSVGASALAGAAIREVFPAGALAGASGIAGAAIRRAVATGALAGAGSTTGHGKRIVWTVGTLTGAVSLVEGVPTTRIFAPAWGNSSLTGDTQVAYVGQASAWSPAILKGLGGYVLVESAETLSGTSDASSIQGANLKAGAVVCDGTSDLVGTADSLVVGASEADGSCVAQADTCVAFVAGGIVLAGDGFDLDGNPQPSSTSASAGAITHAGASAPGGARVEGSAPTPVAASGTITGSSDILYLEVVIYGAEGLEGISATDASASLDMRVHALSVNLSYPVATANYDPVLMTGTFLGGSIARGLATVAWNERPPR
jgi:hypothetical protein